MEDDPPIPSALHDVAFRSGSEWAWRPDDLPAVAEALGEAGCAILGGEVWVVRRESIDTLLRVRRGVLPAVLAWETRSRRVGETWRAYVRRTVEETLEETRGLTDDVDPGDGEVWIQIEWEEAPSAG